MDACLLQYATLVPLELTWNGSISTAHQNGQLGCESSQYHMSGPISRVLDLFLSARSLDDGGAGQVTYELNIPGVYHQTVIVPGYLTTGTTKVEFINRRVYLDINQYYVRMDSIKWYHNGSLYATITVDALGNPLIWTSTYLCASGVPLDGIPPMLTPIAGFDPIIAPLPILYVPDYTLSASCTGTLGYTFNIDGVTNAWPMTGQTASIPSESGCACSPGTPSSVSATTTASVSAFASYSLSHVNGTPTHYICDCPPGSFLNTPMEADVYSINVTVDIDQGRIMVLPDHEKKVYRINPNYGAKIFRGGMPKTSRHEYSTCQTTDASGTTTSSSTNNYTEVHPRRSSILFVAGDAIHAAEDVLSDHSYYPYERFISRQVYTEDKENITVEGLCQVVEHGPLTAPAQCWTLVGLRSCYGTRGVTFPITEPNTELIPYFGTIYDDATYINTVCTPHQSYIHGFTPYSVNGIPLNPEDYAVPMGEAWFDDSVLPAGERTYQRNTICLEPLMDGGLPIWIKTNLVNNAQTSFWGDGYFKTFAPTVPASVSLNVYSEPAWTFTNATASFSGSGITLTPSGTPITADYDLGRWTELPYMIPLIADKITVDWADAGITSVTVQLVSADGSTTTLGTTKTTYDIPSAADAKYAGSWAQDYGMGVVTDTGIDSNPEGRSSTTMADPELVHAFELLQVRQGAKLRFIIVPT